MEDKYFENLLNESSIPFPEFLSQLDSCQPFPLFEEDSLFNSPMIEQMRSDNLVPSLLLSSPRPNLVPQHSAEESASSFSGSKESEILPNAEEQTITQEKNKGLKRTRSKAEILEEDKKQTRAERNRKYAKESRERKKKYIEELEAEIRRLKYELEMYKIRYKSYEAIETCRSSYNNEMNIALTKTYKEMREKQLPISDKKAFMKSLNNSFKKIMDDQMAALMNLGKLVVDIVMPLPQRIHVWISENHIDTNNPEDVVKALSPIINIEQARLIMDYAKQVDPDGAKQRETNKRTKQAFTNTKIALRSIVESVKSIQYEFKNLGDYLSNNILPSFTPYVLEIMANLTSQIMAKSEINTFATNHLFKDLAMHKPTEKSITS